MAEPVRRRGGNRKVARFDQSISRQAKGCDGKRTPTKPVLAVTSGGIILAAFAIIGRPLVVPRHGLNISDPTRYELYTQPTAFPVQIVTLGYIESHPGA